MAMVLLDPSMSALSIFASSGRIVDAMLTCTTWIELQGVGSAEYLFQFVSDLDTLFFLTIIHNDHELCELMDDGSDS